MAIKKKKAKPKKKKAVKAKKKTAKNKGGRPSKYKVEFIEQARKLTILGAIDKDLCDFFSVTEPTLNAWKKNYPKFMEALVEGKGYADHRVKRSLFESANGYSHPEEKIFLHEGEVVRAKTTKHYPPNATSIIFWLKNRDSGNWRDRHDIESKTETVMRVVSDKPMSIDEWSDEYGSDVATATGATESTD